MSGMIVSHHFLRRTARARAHWMEAHSNGHYTIERARRGPYRWRVVRTLRPAGGYYVPKSFDEVF